MNQTRDYSDSKKVWMLLKQIERCDDLQNVLFYIYIVLFTERMYDQHDVNVTQIPTLLYCAS